MPDRSRKSIYIGPAAQGGVQPISYMTMHPYLHHNELCELKLSKQKSCNDMNATFENIIFISFHMYP